MERENGIVRIPVRRAINRLRAIDIERLPPGLHADGGNLCLLVRPSGARSWIFRYRVNGRLRAHGIGSAITVSLAEARRKALELRQQRLAGLDPIEAKRAARVKAEAEQAKAMTFKQAADAYIRAHDASWKSAKHALQWGATLTRYAFPVLGGMAVGDVDTGAIIKVLEGIWREKPETAGRVRGRIEMVLDWAAARGFRFGDNPARWKGHLSHLLPARSKIAPVKHHDAMPYDQVPAFMAELAQLEGVSAIGFRFLILTAARTGEVVGARWAEIDLQERIWTVPAERMKAAREHRVPLSAGAIQVLRDAQQLRADGGEFVFPGGKQEAPLSNMAFLTLLKRREKDCTAHGFRSAFRDWVRECTDHGRDVAEAALAHTLESKVEAAYARGDMLEKRRRLMDDWAAFCLGNGEANGVRLENNAE